MVEIKRVVQCIIGIAFLVVVIVNFRYNHIGQNVINTLTAFVFITGLDNIIIFYRFYLDESSYEHEATFSILSIFILGLLFQNFNSSPKNEMFLNQFCYLFLIILLSINGLCYIGILLILKGYFIRHIYRLMTDKLLTNSLVLEPEQLEILMRQRKTFNNIQKQYPQINTQCAICISQFEQNNMCIILPECQHCFHHDCIQAWLRNKSTCPYCRSNIHVNLL